MHLTPEFAVEAIIGEVRRRIPTPAELTGISDPNDMGSDVTIPALWMSMLLTHIEGLERQARISELEARCSLPATKAPENADEMSDYAAALAHHSVATHAGDRIDAAGSLFQAGTAILIAELPREGVIDTLNSLADFFNLGEVLGMEATQQ